MKVSASSSFFELRVVRGFSVKTGVSVASGAEMEGENSKLSEHINARREVQANAASAFKSNPKQAALDKAAILKRRLEILKAMLLFASPEAAKSIARQLKGIAGELASLSKSVGASASGSAALAVPTAAPSDGEATGSVATVEASVEEAVVQTTISPPSTDSDTQQNDDGSNIVGEKSGDEATKAGESTQKSGDNALRKAVEDAKRLLKELILRVKAKLLEGDDEARRDLQAAENSLAELDRALAQETSANLYTAGGGLTPDAAGTDLSLSSAGASVDVSV